MGIVSERIKKNEQVAQKRKQIRSDVIRLKNEGKSNNDISKELGISEAVVRIYSQKGDLNEVR